MKLKLIPLTISILVVLTILAVVLSRWQANKNIVLGHQFYQQQNYIEARKYYSRATSWNPRSGEANAWLGVSLQKLDQGENAAEALNRGLKLGYDGYEVRLALGLIYLNQNIFQQAIDQLKKALQFKPDDDEANRYLAIALLEDSNSIDEALTRAVEATRNNPDSPSAWSTLSAVYIKGAKYDAAIEAADKAIQLNLNFCGAYNNKADALLHLGNHEASLAEINRGLQVASIFGPNLCLVALYTTRGQIYEELKRTTDALESYNMAIDVSVTDQYAQSYKATAKERAQVLQGSR